MDAGVAAVWDAVFFGAAVVGTVISGCGCGCGGRVCLFSFRARSFAVEMSLRMVVEMADTRKLATEKGTMRAARKMADQK